MTRKDTFEATMFVAILLLTLSAMAYANSGSDLLVQRR